MFVKVFAIEMVYIPSGNFQLGSGSQSEAGFRIANDVSDAGTATTFTVTSTSPTLQGNDAGSSGSNLSTTAGFFLDLGTSNNTATLASGFPTGYGAFYSMKYEISQGQYRDFLNTLTYSQQVNRTAFAPNSSVGTGALVSSGTDRNGIEISSAGTYSNIPAMYGCDLNNNNVFDETDDGEWITCNYLSWADLAAYLDWAGLRPITELEFEKIGRGPNTPVVDEFGWGGTTIVGLTALSNTNQTNEVSNTTNANALYGNNLTSGPARVGIFATSISDRNAAGSSYYGVMDLTGNVWEQVIKIENSTGRSFTGTRGDGQLTSNGDADASSWPDYTGACKRGGGWLTIAQRSQLSSRYGAGLNGANRNAETGGRGAR